MRAVTVALAVAALSLSAPMSDAGPYDAVVTSPNVTFVATIPLDAGAATGARLLGKTLYVSGSKAFSIYDVSDPELPKPLSVTPVGFNFPAEDVDTNGRILLLNDEQGALGTLQVYDVGDKAAPKRIASLPNLRDHTFTCVLGCAWAYGSRGTIVDLRKPASPRVAGHWASLPTNDGFDVTEVSPGMVLTSSRTIRLLDARGNPAKPRLVRTGTTSDNRLLHSNRWPRQGRDRFFLVQGETPFSGVCDRDSGAIMTWDARTFRKVDEFRVSNGVFVDGSPAAGAAGCTAMWFQQHPAFKDGGLVAAGFFEHGVRFLDVDKRGRIDEVGYYAPVAGATIAAYWITPEIVYAVDIEKGIDILRYDRTATPAKAPVRPPVPRKIEFAPPGRRALWCRLRAA
jgi:hypothetical protein